MKKRNAFILLVVAFTFWGLCCHAQSSKIQVTESSSVLQRFVGRWYPDKTGWHDQIDISINDGKLLLIMHTDEGDKRFEEVRVNESEPSIEWSYCDELEAVWSIGTWSETKREEIIVNLNRIVASCGVPTEVYQSHDEATHAKQEWKYFAVLVDDKLILSNGYKTDYFSPSGKLMFMKSRENRGIITYRK